MTKKPLVCNKCGVKLAYSFENERLVMFKCPTCRVQSYLYREHLKEFDLPEFKPFSLGKGHCSQCGEVEVLEGRNFPYCSRCGLIVVTMSPAPQS